VNVKKHVALIGVLVLLFGTAGTLWAFSGVLDSDWNRPTPLMDYVPQELGIYDTWYPNLGEYDCRFCHSDSLADRHHFSDRVIVEHKCTPCHSEDGNGEVILPPRRDCASADDCHAWADIGGNPLYTNGWHHATDESGSQNCVACHDRNIVADIQEFRSVAEYPPSFITPTPFSCENCHWEQEVISAGPAPETNELDAGHPSSYDHYDPWANFVGYYEYGKPINDNRTLHEFGMEGTGNVEPECYLCHSIDPDNPLWDPDNDENIRYCERCHDINTLHAINAHVGIRDDYTWQGMGWEAIGWKVPGSDGTITQPTDYRAFSNSGWPNPEDPDEMCLGCHGDELPLIDPPTSACTPFIDAAADSFEPSSGCEGTLVTIRGGCFDDSPIEGISHVQITPNSAVDWSTAPDLPIYSWNATQVQVLIPQWDYAPGNYRIRVTIDTAGSSGERVFTMLDCRSPVDISPDRGPCLTDITLFNEKADWPANQVEMMTLPADPDYGLYRVIDIVASQGVFTVDPANVAEWGLDTDSGSGFDGKGDTMVFKFKNFYEDELGDLPNRNYLQDGEPSMISCEDIGLGPWNVIIRNVIFYDANGNDTYDAGDVIEQVVSSTPVLFTLTNDPYIRDVLPRKTEPGQKVKILGGNFGPSQSTSYIKIGDAVYGPGHPKIKMWSAAKIKVKVKNMDCSKFATTDVIKKNVSVWVDQGTTGFAPSNKFQIKILKPLTCP